MTNTDSTPFTPRVVGTVPPAKRGTAMKEKYNKLFDLVWSNRPDAVLVAEGVPAHHSTMVSEALARRIDMPGNEHIKAEGSFLVETRINDSGAGPVDVYATFVLSNGR